MILMNGRIVKINMTGGLTMMTPNGCVLLSYCPNIDYLFPIVNNDQLTLIINVMTRLWLMAFIRLVTIQLTNDPLDQMWKL